MRTIAVGLLALLLFGCDGSVYLGGIVLTPEGVPIGDANITLSRKPSSRTFTTTSHANGCFMTGGVVAPGRYDYDVLVEAPGRKPAAGRVRTLSSNVVVVRLQPDTVLTPSELMPATADPCSPTAASLPDAWRNAGLSREDAESLVNESLRLVVERKCLVENTFTDVTPVLETNIAGLQLRPVGSVSFESISENTLAERAVPHLRFRKVARQGSNIVVELDNVKPGFGSGTVIEFARRDGKWTHSCTRGWIE